MVMNTIIQYKNTTYALRSKLILDVDANAERINFIDRKHSVHVRTVVLYGETNLVVVLPKEFSVRNDIVALLLDDNKLYNAAVVEGVQCELFNCVTIDSGWN
jgi:hypothetical protein